MKIYFIVVFTLISYVAFSCSCIVPDEIDENQYNSYDLILKGKIINITKNKQGTFLTIKVDKYYKGDLQKNIVKVNTPNTEGLCGLYVNVGETWLIFAYNFKSLFKSDQCTRSKRLSNKPLPSQSQLIKAELEFLERKQKL